MLQKDSSITKSFASNTGSIPGHSLGHSSDTPIQFVKGVGPRLGSVFASRGISTVRDLLHFFPRAYEDRSKLLQVKDLPSLAAGEKATISLQVVSSKKIPIPRQRRSFLEVRAQDGTGTLILKWFHTPRGMETRFTTGAQLIATGPIKTYQGRAEMIHPEITWGLSADLVDQGQPNVGRLIPVYTEIEGIPSRTLRKVLWEAVQKFIDTLQEDLPQKFRTLHGLPPLSRAVRLIHFPEEAGAEKIQALVDFDTPAHWRLIYEEFFKFEYLILRQRLRMERVSAPVFGPNGGRDAAASLTALLPFQLTGDQKAALADVFADLASSHPMNRLIQGDVGSGKTAVAFVAASSVLAEGSQAALMAPTEILAEQHYRTAIRLFGGRLNVALLTGKTTQAERNSLLPRLAAGEPLLLIGTHALIEDPVVFKSLGLVMIDEQHRFGVEQRRTLRNKGLRRDRDGKAEFPHSLILTATPIPRTLALTAYGDLSVTTIRELPPGRTPVLTKVVSDRTARNAAYEKVRLQLKAGRQAYFIYPLVNDSEAEGFTSLKSAVTEAERLAREVFSEFRVGVLHGQLKPDEKARVMESFKKHETDVLVSTTVVEVGVDVPNATVMTIEHAERFGLSQLHQLRGRVGRGAHQSFCFLFSSGSPGETTAARLDVLEKTNDGFEIAEADLEIRGPGEFLGTRQAGGLPFRLANLVRDREWLIKARDDASSLLKEDPDLLQSEHQPLRAYFEREGRVQFDRLKTS